MNLPFLAPKYQPFRKAIPSEVALIKKFETIKKRAQSGPRPPGVKRKMFENKRRCGETKKLRWRISG